MPARPGLFVACAPSGSRIHPPYVKLFRKHCPAESTRFVERPKNQGPEQLQTPSDFLDRLKSLAEGAVQAPFFAPWEIGAVIQDQKGPAGGRGRTRPGGRGYLDCRRLASSAAAARHILVRTASSA